MKSPSALDLNELKGLTFVPAEQGDSTSKVREDTISLDDWKKLRGQYATDSGVKSQANSKKENPLDLSFSSQEGLTEKDLMAFHSKTDSTKKPIDLSGFRWRVPLEGVLKVGTPSRVRLTRDLLAHCESECAELAVVDSRGYSVPIVIHDQDWAGAKRESEGRFPFKIISFAAKDGFMELGLEAGWEAGDPGLLYNRLEFGTGSRDFRQAVLILASADKKEWREVEEDTIFDFRPYADIWKTTVDFPPLRDRFLKVVLLALQPSIKPANSQEALNEDLDFAFREQQNSVTLEGVHGWREKHNAFSVRDSAVFSAPQVTKDGQGSVLVHLGRTNLPVSRIGISSDEPFFFRRVEVWTSATGKLEDYQPVGAGVIHRIPGLQQSVLEFGINPLWNEYLQIRIGHHKSRPLSVKAAKVGWAVKNLYFVPEEGESYSLYLGKKTQLWGNGEPLEQRDSALAHILGHKQAALGEFPELRLGERVENTTVSAARARWGQGGLYALGLILALGVWILRHRRKTAH